MDEDDDYETVEAFPQVPVKESEEERIVLSNISRRFDEILPALGDDTEASPSYRVAALGLRETIGGVQQLVGCFPVDRMQEAEKAAAIEGLGKIALGISRTISGLRSLEEVTRISHNNQIQGLVAPLQKICAETETATMEAVLEDTAARIHTFVNEESSGLSSVLIIALLAALAVIAILLTMLKLSPLVAVDAVLATLAVLIQILAVL